MTEAMHKVRFPRERTLDKTEPPASRGCAEKNSQHIAEWLGKAKKHSVEEGKEYECIIRGGKCCWEVKGGKLWEASIRFSDKAVSARAGLWRGKSDSKTEVSWGEEKETLNIQNSITKFICEEGKVDRDKALED